jgi:dihydrofolate synthase/folylpolyglutamate synthase
MSVRTYQEALDYLYSFVDYSLERSYRYSAELFDLSRVRTLLRLLGDPHERYPAFHIAGTKGKGSVTAMLASCLRAAGYRTAMYTSPHLVHFTERIQVDGEPISEAELVAGVNEIQPHVGQVPNLTEYEIVTAIAFAHFARAGVQAAAIEVGLGGRLDATNVLRPVVSIITSLSYDHMHLLGDRLSDIAREKAGIIKPGVPVVSSPQQIEAERVIEEVARSQGSPLIRVGHDWLYAPGGHDLDGQALHVWSADEQPLMDAFVESAGGEEWAPPRYEIPLLGHHQVVNGAVAYAALRAGRERGLPVGEEAIHTGLRSVRWPGRFQILSRSPMIVVDSAHNRDSALKLRIALDDYFPGQPVTLVFGASADKDIEGMFIELAPRVSRVIVTQAVHPRAAEPAEVVVLAHQHGLQTEVVSPVRAALERAIDRARPNEVIVSAGSLFVSAEILAAWEAIAARLRAQGLGATS